MRRIETIKGCPKVFEMSFFNALTLADCVFWGGLGGGAWDAMATFFLVGRFQDVRTQLDITEDASKELCRAVRCGSRQRRVETKVEQLAEEGDGCDRFSLQKEVVELYLQLEQPCLAVDYVRVRTLHIHW